MKPLSANRVPAETPATRTARWFPVIIAVGAIAAWAARPLLPSEVSTLRGWGLPFVLVWLSIAVLVAIRGAAADRNPFWLDKLDLIFLIFAGLYGISATVGMQGGAPRPAMNMAWEMAASVVSLIVARRLANYPVLAKGALALLLGVALGAALYGFYQVGVSLPETRREFESNPARYLKEAGLSLDEETEQLFRDRLNGSEPMSTFELTNSLAGFLLPWLMLSLGLALSAGATKQVRSVSGAVFLCVLVCLVLTKSRSAYLAAGLGMMAVVPLTLGWHQKITPRHWKAVLGLAVVCGVVVAGGVLSGALDKQVLTEAGKSLSYRLQYWQSSLQIIQESPWLGCGPGNFGDVYTRFKLPEASEEIKDPHNFVFEIWANAGSLTLAMLLLGLGYWALLAWKQLRNAGLPVEAPVKTDAGTPPTNATGATTNATPFKSAPQGSRPGERRPLSQGPGVQGRSGALPAVENIAWVFVAAGLALLLMLTAGVTIGYWTSWSHALLIGLLPMGLMFAAAAAGVLYGLKDWISSGSYPRWLPALAAAVLLLDLLAAGGFTFAGVSGSLWLMVGLAAPAGKGLVRRSHSAEEASDRSTADADSHLGLGPGQSPIIDRVLEWGPFRGVVFIGSLAMFLTFLGLAYLPVIRQTELLKAAQSSPNAAAQRRKLVQAAEADPWNADLWSALSEEAFIRWQERPEPDTWKEVEFSLQGLVAAGQQSSESWLQVAQFHELAYERTGDRALLDKSVQAFETCVTLYPHHAARLARWALALAEQGQQAQADLVAARAWQQDAITPHKNLKLQAELRERLTRKCPQALGGDLTET